MSMESPRYCCRSTAQFQQKSSECSAVSIPFPQWRQIGDGICPIKAWYEAVEVSLLSDRLHSVLAVKHQEVFWGWVDHCSISDASLQCQSICSEPSSQIHCTMTVTIVNCHELAIHLELCNHNPILRSFTSTLVFLNLFVIELKQMHRRTYRWRDGQSLHCGLLGKSHNNSTRWHCDDLSNFLTDS